MFFNHRFLTIGLFVAACILTSFAVVFGFFLVEAVGFYGTRQPAVAPANFPHLSQDLRNNLNGALSPEFPFNFETVGNPFADKTGVSGKTTFERGSTLVPPSAPVSTAKNGFQNISPLMPVKMGGTNSGFLPPPNPINMNSSSVPQPVVISRSDPKELLAERNRQLRQGKEVGDVASIYSVDDVRPIGVVGSGTRNRVLLYAPSTGQTFSVGRGTRFRDGSIEAFDNEGAQFRRLDGSIVNNRWMKTSEKSPLREDADAPFLRVPDEQTVQTPIPTPLPQIQPTQDSRRRNPRRKSKRSL